MVREKVKGTRGERTVFADHHLNGHHSSNLPLQKSYYREEVKKDRERTRAVLDSQCNSRYHYLTVSKDLDHLRKAQFLLERLESQLSKHEIDDGNA
jgi:hypothetical protein